MSSGTVITNKGVQLLAKLAASGNSLSFTRAAVGSGTVPDGTEPQELENLTEWMKDGQIVSCSALEDTASFVIQVSSEGVLTGFLVTEMGLYATDPDAGEILYAYLDMAEDPQYIYAYGSAVVKFLEITIHVVIDRATAVTAYFAPSGLVRQEDLIAATDVKIDASGGDISETVIEALETTETKFPIPAAGEKVKTFFGKILTFLKNIKPLEASVTYYVATTGSNITGTGTSANPFRTIEKALNMIPKNLNGYGAIINIREGTFAEALKVTGFHGGAINIVGAGDTTIIESSTTLNEINFCACRLSLRNMKIQRSTVATAGTVLLVEDVYNISCRNVTVEGTNTSTGGKNTGITLYGSVGEIENCIFNNCGICIYLPDGVNGDVPPSIVSVTKCTGTGNDRVYVNRGNQIIFQDNIRPSVTGGNVLANGGIVVKSSGAIIGTLMADTALHVSLSGSDSTGDGSSATPFQTIARALAEIPKDLNGRTATINIAAGTYSEAVAVQGYYAGTLNIIGAGSTTTISETGAQNRIYETTARVNVQNIKFRRPTSTTTGQPVVDIRSSTSVMILNCIIDGTNSLATNNNGLHFASAIVEVDSCTFTNCNVCNHAIVGANSNSCASTVTFSNLSGAGNEMVYANRCSTFIFKDNKRPTSTVADLTDQGGVTVSSHGAIIGTLMANTTYYVDASAGSDTTGTGTSGNPFKTVQRAVEVIPKDLGGFNAYIYLANGTYTEDVYIQGFYAGNIQIYGNSTNVTACKIDGRIEATHNKFVLFHYIELTGLNGTALVLQQCNRAEFEYITVTTSAEHPGITVNRVDTFVGDQLVISNRNFGLNITQSRGALAAVSGSNNAVAIRAQWGAIVSFVGTENTVTGTEARFRSENGGTFIQSNGTPISEIISSGLSCTWGTLEGGYFRNGQPRGGKAMITLNIAITTTSALTAGTQYSLYGVPTGPTVSVAVSCSHPTRFSDIFVNGASTQVVFVPAANVPTGTRFVISATYPTNS
ncbi:hypothetical protein AALB39_18190 [Lachnospiraceae bacterium 54-53]